MNREPVENHPLSPSQNVQDSTTYLPSSFGSTLNSMYQRTGRSANLNYPLSPMTNKGFVSFSPIKDSSFEGLQSGSFSRTSFSGGVSRLNTPNVFNTSSPQNVSTGVSDLNVEGAMGGAEEAIEGTEAISSLAMDADPVTAIAQVGRMMGNGLNSIMSASANFNTNSDYVHTMATGHGIGLQQTATNVASLEYSNNSLSSLGGSLGALFGGPLGALAGRGIASLFENNVNDGRMILNTPNGMRDPQAGTTPQSQSSRQPGEQPTIDTQGAGTESFNNDSASTTESNTDTEQAQDATPQE